MQRVTRVVAGGLVVTLTFEAAGLVYVQPALPLDRPPHYQDHIETSSASGTAVLALPVAVQSTSTAALKPTILTWPMNPSSGST